MSVLNYIYSNENSAKKRIFDSLTRNENTKQIFKVAGETPTNWFALLITGLIGIGAGIGGMFAFRKFQKPLNEISKYFNHSELTPEDKQKIILNQISDWQTKGEEDNFYQKISKNAFNKLDIKKKQTFLVNELTTTPSIANLSIADLIVNQLDTDDKQKLNISVGGIPKTSDGKAKLIKEWLNDSSVKNHSSLIGLFIQRAAPKGTYFLGEVLTATGPRKVEDTELGEDIAGMMIKDDYAIFWIMDGSSNYAKIKDGENKEIYSSRVLATVLAEQVQNVIRQEQVLQATSVKKYLQKAVDNTLKYFNTQVNATNARPIIERRLDSGESINIATTATLGILHKNGTLSSCKVGDDKVLAGTKFLKSKHGALLIYDIHAETNQLIVSAADLKPEWYETYEYQNVQTVLASSDGISDAMYTRLANNLPQGLMAAKLHNNQMFDDKSLCIIQIID